MRMKFATLALAAATGAVDARPPRRRSTPINVSYQPSLYWALPYYIATEKGWWKEVGLAPDLSDLPGRRAAGRRRAGEILGRRRHRLGAGRARRGALRPAHDRHHQ